MDLRTVEISEKEKHEYLTNLKLLNDFCDSSEYLKEENIQFLKKFLPELIGILPIKINPVKSFSQPFQRVVINETIKGKNEWLYSLKDLRYPPLINSHKLDYNRASLKGQSIFYAGYGMLAVAIETKPRMGQLITESRWKIKSGKTLNLIIVCQDEDVAMANPHEILEDYNRHLEILEELKPNIKEVVSKVYELIVKAFTRQVNPDYKQGYLMSALISNMFFTQKENPVDAIWYPSVPNEGSSMNIAVKPEIVDEKFEMINATTSFVTRSNSLGMYHPLSECKSYNSDTLELNWTNVFIHENDPIRFVMNDYGITPIKHNTNSQAK